MAKYWLSSLDIEDDFGDRYDTVMIDGRTKKGPWANMTQRSWAKHGVDRFGTGFGQRYEKQANGKWLKVEG